MRKSDREITDFEEIVKIIDGCETVRLGLYGDDYPYIVPLSFGYEAGNGKICVYFHCATEGKKIDLIGKDNRACMEFDRLNAYADTGHSVTADYESVMLFGRVEKCEGEEKVKGLGLLLSHCGFGDGKYPARDCAALPRVAVYKLESETLTGKRRFKR